MVAGLDVVMAEAGRTLSEADGGQAGLFGGEVQPLRLPETPPWPPTERLAREHAAVGFYLSAHPLDEYRPVLAALRVQMWSDFAEAVKRGASAGRLVGTVTARQERRTRTGNRMGIIKMSDPTGQYEAVAFSETLAENRDLLEPGQSVILFVGAEEREDGISVRIQNVEALDGAALKMKKGLRIYLRDAAPIEPIARQLPAGGDGEVSLVLMVEAGKREVEVRLPGKYRLSPPLAGALRTVPGIVQVEFA